MFFLFVCLLCFELLAYSCQKPQVANPVSFPGNLLNVIAGSPSLKPPVSERRQGGLSWAWGSHPPALLFEGRGAATWTGKLKPFSFRGPRSLFIPHLALAFSCFEKPWPSKGLYKQPRAFLNNRPTTPGSKQKTFHFGGRDSVLLSWVGWRRGSFLNTISAVISCSFKGARAGKGWGVEAIKISYSFFVFCFFFLNLAT